MYGAGNMSDRTPRAVRARTPLNCSTSLLGFYPGSNPPVADVCLCTNSSTKLLVAEMWNIFVQPLQRQTTSTKVPTFSAGACAGSHICGFVRQNVAHISHTTHDMFPHLFVARQSWCRNASTLFHCSRRNPGGQVLFQKLNSWSCSCSNANAHCAELFSAALPHTAWLELLCAVWGDLH
jgi:hypothetical protein